ncbi:uncharacterized protein LOC129959643 [Argiope bruennichi]|uniref:uncharacterized protein LOC129959643 n=1 Tax=Argiope bruennichi TaxID=94029 RepID=UPI002493DBCB|nr:uncharacterized protein LOC129959643 [Argiope bruennichi]
MRDELICLRFMFLISHLLFLLMILIFKKEGIAEKNVPIYLNVKDGELQAHYVQDDLQQIINRYTVVFSVSTTLLSVEFLSFIAGVSMFTKWQNQVSIICHLLGTCFLSFLLYVKWNDELFYSSFLLCAVLPFITEAFPAANHLLVKV